MNAIELRCVTPLPACRQAGTVDFSGNIGSIIQSFNYSNNFNVEKHLFLKHGKCKHHRYTVIRDYFLKRA